MAEGQRIKIVNIIWGVDTGKDTSVTLRNGDRTDELRILEVFEAGDRHYVVMVRREQNENGKRQLLINRLMQDEEHYIKITGITEKKEMENAKRIMQDFERGVRILNINGVMTPARLLGLYNLSEVPYIAFRIPGGSKSEGSVMLFRYGITQDGHRLYNLIQSDEEYAKAKELFLSWLEERLGAGREQSNETLARIQAKRAQEGGGQILQFAKPGDVEAQIDAEAPQAGEEPQTEE